MSDKAQKLLEYITEEFVKTGKDIFQNSDYVSTYGESAAKELSDFGYVKIYISGSITLDNDYKKTL